METTTLYAGIASVVLAITHGVARRFEEALSGVPRNRWLSIGGGVSVAYVFVHLLPEIAAQQRELEDAGALPAGVHLELWLGALAGLVAFYGLERLIATREGDATADGDPAGWLHLGSYGLYNAVAGYVLVEQAEHGATVLAFYTLAIGVHFLVNDQALVEDHGRLYRRRGRWLLAGAVIAGWAISLVGPLPAAVVPTSLAFLAGGIVLNVLKEELPEERRSRFGTFALAAAAYAALLVVV